MKKNISFTLLFMAGLFAMNSCKKNTTSPPPNDEITIESWSPERPEFGDEITINGKGFNPDTALNVVEFGGAGASIIAASATQLKVIVPEVDGLTPGYYSYVRVKANDKEAIAEPFYFSRSLSISSVKGRGPGNTMLPGDSIIIEGAGFSATADKNSIKFIPTLFNTTPYGNVTPVSCDSSFWCKLRGFYKSSECAGQGREDLADTATLSANLEFSFKGKTIKKPVRLYAFPFPSYQYVSHTTANGYRFVRIRHKSILPGTKVRWVYPNLSTVESSFGPEEYSDSPKETNLIVLQSNMPPGNYRVVLFRNNMVYMNRAITF